MKHNIIRRLTGILLLSILVVKTLVGFVPFVTSQFEEATLTELMLEQKEGKGKESLKEISVQEFFRSNFTYHFLEPSVSLSSRRIIFDAKCLCSFFPSILTPPPNC